MSELQPSNTTENTRSPQGSVMVNGQNLFSSIASTLRQEFGSRAQILEHLNEIEIELKRAKVQNKMLREALEKEKLRNEDTESKSGTASERHKRLVATLKEETRDFAYLRHLMQENAILSQQWEVQQKTIEDYRQHFEKYKHYYATN